MGRAHRVDPPICRAARQAEMADAILEQASLRQLHVERAPVNFGQARYRRDRRLPFGLGQSIGETEKRVIG